MIFRIEVLKKICSNLSSVIDVNNLSHTSQLLEIITEDGIVKFNLSNVDYDISLGVELDDAENFHACVNAELFLGLILKTTSDTVEFEIKENQLHIIGNGEYNIPLVYQEDSMTTLSKITLNNIVNQFKIPTDNLYSMLKFNSNGVAKNNICDPIYKLFYLDKDGCITFNQGAFVNTFSLDITSKLLLPFKIVNLFKLFSDPSVDFSIAYDESSNEMFTTKISIEDSHTKVNALLPSDNNSLMKIPVENIRNRANKLYDNTITIDRTKFLETIDRLDLFNKGYSNKVILNPYNKIIFNDGYVTLYDCREENFENIFYYLSNSENITPYTTYIDLIDFKNALSTFSSKDISLSFGDSEALVLTEGARRIIIPECSN